MSGLVGIWHRSNLVTYLGLAVAAVGCALTLVDPGWAVLCLVVAGVCDLLDGTFARRFARDEATKRFGIQLDSLADMVGFVVLPAVVVVAFGLPWWVVAVVLAVYALAAVTRLAYFNVVTDGTPRTYRGLPVTYAALVLPVVWLACTLLGVGPGWAWASCLVVLAVLFVVDVPVPKPRGRGTVVFLLIAVGLCAGVVAVQVAG